MTTFTATYSPDDNKIRLYASARLDPETYARVKAAGFAWAPKQGLFVAPAWSPSREDLARELAGEIDDEDTSLAQRAEDRAERFEEYQAHRQQDASDAHATVSRIMGNIPMGQPVLVGHHSERHHRRDLARVDAAMSRAVHNWKTAQYWEGRAAAAIAHAKYKERPDVRARRIKKIEAERRKLAAQMETTEARAKLWASLVAKNATREQAREVANLSSFYVIHDDTTWRSAYDVLAPEDERPFGNCPSWTVEQVADKARAIADDFAPRAQRWLDHYDMRLAYERAMLAADGGTVTDRTGPEKGGACRCWASPGRFDSNAGWSYIVKVNKVSVTVYDNWGNGGNHFTRTVPFDKLTAVMSAAEVQDARDGGRITDCPPDGTGKVEGFYLAPEPSAVAL